MPTGNDLGGRVYRDLELHQFTSQEKIWICQNITEVSAGIFVGIPSDVGFTAYPIAARHNISYNTLKSWLLRCRRGGTILGSSKGGRPCLLDNVAIASGRTLVVEAGGPNNFNAWRSSRSIRDFANDTRERGRNLRTNKPIHCVQTIRKYKRIIFV